MRTGENYQWSAEVEERYQWKNVNVELWTGDNCLCPNNLNLNTTEDDDDDDDDDSCE